MDIVKRACCMLYFAALGVLSVYGALPVESHWANGSVLENMTDNRKTWLWKLPSGSRRLTVGVRTRNLHAEPCKKYGRHKVTEYSPGQGVCALSASGDTLSVKLMVHRLQNSFDYDDEMVAHVYYSNKEGKLIDQIIPLTKGLFPQISNEMSIRVSFNNSGITVEAGNKEMKRVAEYESIGFAVDSVGFVLEPGAKVDKVVGSALSFDSTFPDNERIADLNKLRVHIDMSSDPLEGEWEYLDRQMDESLLRPGGEYRLLIVKDTGDVYSIYYVSGARVNPGQWRAGMMKGRLQMMSPDRYDLWWRDADGEWMMHGLKAAMEDENILALLFPYQASTVRLLRVR